MKLRTSSAGEAAGMLAIFALVLLVGMIAFAIYTQKWVIGLFYVPGTLFTALGAFLAWRSRSTYLVIDRDRGMATYLVGRRELRTVRLDELVPLTILHVGKKHHLMSPVIPASLMTHNHLPIVEERRDLLQHMADVMALRQLLANAVPPGEAYRDGPDVMFRVKTAIPEQARLRAALTALVDDPHVGAQARAMATRDAGVQDADTDQRVSDA